MYPTIINYIKNNKKNNKNKKISRGKNKMLKTQKVRRGNVNDWNNLVILVRGEDHDESYSCASQVLEPNKILRPCEWCWN